MCMTCVLCVTCVVCVCDCVCVRDTLVKMRVCLSKVSICTCASAQTSPQDHGRIRSTAQKSRCVNTVCGQTKTHGDKEGASPA